MFSFDSGQMFIYSLIKLIEKNVSDSHVIKDNSRCIKWYMNCFYFAFYSTFLQTKKHGISLTFTIKVGIKVQKYK